MCVRIRSMFVIVIVIVIMMMVVMIVRALTLKRPQAFHKQRPSNKSNGQS